MNVVSEKQVRVWRLIAAGSALKLRPRHKWFSASDRNAESWSGPFHKFEDAIADQANDMFELRGPVYPPIYVTQGRRLSACERIEGSELPWSVDPKGAIEVRL